MSKLYWIIGASSGIGRELAIDLSQKGHKLILSARRKKELEALNQELGEQHKVTPLDITDEQAVVGALNDMDILDSVIIMSGIYAPSSVENMTIENLHKIIDVNLYGPIMVSKKVLDKFQKQGYGQIILCASVSGYTGLPNAQPYGATKAGLINFAETLHAECKPKNIDVKVINPGFVKTPMTDQNDFDMPMIISSEDAAQEISEGMQRSAFEIHMPKKFTYIMKLVSSLPYWIKMPLLNKLTRT